MRGRIAGLTLGALLLFGCAPFGPPVAPGTSVDTPPSATPTVGVCTVKLPDQWTQAIKQGKVPQRDRMQSQVLHVAPDGSMLVVLSPPGRTSGSTAPETVHPPDSTPTPGRTTSTAPGETGVPRPAGARPADQSTNGPTVDTSPTPQPRPSQPGSAPSHGGNPNRSAELWYFDRDFTHPVKVLTAPDGSQHFLDADFDGRYYVFLVAADPKRGGSIYSWDAFGQEPPEQITTNNQGLLTPPVVDQGVVAWGQTAGDGQDGALVRYQLATRSRTIMERTYFGPGSYPRRNGSTITWADDRGRFQAVDLHNGTEVSVPTTVTEQRDMREFSHYRDLWLWTTAERTVVAWHTAWPKPSVLTVAEGVERPSVGDNYATFDSAKGVYLWDSRAQSMAIVSPKAGRAELFGSWLVVETADGASVVNTRRLPPLLPC